MKRYLWYSDTHLDKAVLPFLKRRFIRRLHDAKADGVIITGDISTGLHLERDLRFLARNYDGAVYFVLGNHDYHGRFIASVHDDVRRLCMEHRNLHWLTTSDVVTLADDVALIGTEGWYDASLGDPEWLRWTTDYWATPDFLVLDGMAERIHTWRRMAQHGAELVAERLERALEDHQTIYVATHFPPWPEATRAVGTLMEQFWLPYNTNATMGAAIERVMEGRKKRRVVVLAGHTHTPCQIRVSSNIQCMVARSSYMGRVLAEDTIVL